MLKKVELQNNGEAGTAWKSVYIRVDGKLKCLVVKDHGLPLGNAAVNPQDTVKAMLAAFSATKQRCYNPECPDYQFYGARGITISDRWLSDPLNMVVDMGLRPEGHTLDRIDNSGPYCVNNCRWATRQTQMQNTRAVTLVEYHGEVHSIAEWERIQGFKPGTLKARLTRLGYSVEEAMTKEVKPGGLLAGRHYPHLQDQSWRNTTQLRPCKPKFSQDEVSRIREAAQSGLSRSEVARRFNTSVTTVSNIVDRLKAYKDA